MEQFLKDLIERALKTFVQTLAASLTVTGLGFRDIDWIDVLGVAGLAALASVLTSLGSYKIGDAGTASLISTCPKCGEVDCEEDEC